MSGEDPVRFTVLGPMLGRRGATELDLGSRQRRLVLALLLARSGQFVVMDEIVRLVWGAEPPAGAVNVVHQHIAGIRRLLEPDLPARAAGRYLDRQGSAYRLRAPSDLADFRRFAEQAADHTARDRPGEALALYERALRLWQGGFAADLDGDARAHPAIAAVDREHTAAARAAADLILAGAAPGSVLEPLRRAAELHPWDEALQARLIRVLAAGGEAEEARAVHEAVSRRLADELDMAPGPELREAYGSVARPYGKRVGPPAQLPAASRLFNGRQAEMRALTALLPTGSPGRGRPAPAETAGSEVVTIAIDGIPGVGKSTLAVQWAHEVAHLFPDGQLFVNLRGYDARGAVVTPDEALAAFLGAIGIAQRDIPAGVEAKTALYRTMMAGRRMLILIDNARDADHVRPLIPGAPGCLVLITSRRRQTGLAALDGAHLLSLDVPTMDEARAQLRLRLGDRRASAEPAALDQIIDSCGRLPLAMALVGARAATHPDDPLRDIADDLRSGDSTLDTLQGEDPERDVRAACSGSYRLLSDDAARLFRQLSLHPGPDVGLATIAGIIGADSRETARLVGELTGTRLLDEHRYRRFVFHDLTRAYAMELAAVHDSAEEQRRALQRIRDHLRLTAHAANEVLMPAMIPHAAPPADPDIRPERLPDSAAAMAWFDAEQPVLETLARSLAGDPGPVRPWEIVLLLLPYYQRTGLYYSWSTTARHALAEAESSGDVLGQAHMLRILGTAEHSQGFAELGLAHLSQALGLFERHGRVAETGFVLNNMGWVEYSSGHADRAAAHYERALRIFTGVDDSRAAALVLMGLGYSRNELKEHGAALCALDQAFRILERLGDRNALASCVDAVAGVHRSRGDYDEAIVQGRLALRLARENGNLANQVEFHTGLGETLALAGRTAEATAELRAAIAMADQAGLTVYAAEARSRLAPLLQ